MSARTRPLHPDDVPQLVALALRAWAPMFASLRRTLGDELFDRLHPNWRRDQQYAVRTRCEQRHGTTVRVADIPSSATSLSSTTTDREGGASASTEWWDPRSGGAVVIADQSAADEYREIAGRFTALVEAVPDDATWERRSPVPEWTARDVLRHLVEWFPPFLAGGTGVVLPRGPGVDDDPVGAWRTMSDGVQAVLDDPTSAGKVLTDPHIGEVPLPLAVSRFFTADVFMHTWDLARATGQDETLDPERCAVMVAGMEPLDDLLRSSGQYGPTVEVPPDADVQTRMLAFIGRDPR